MQTQTTLPPPPAHAVMPPVLRALGPAIDSHVLIIGDDTVDLICALIRQGCPGATAVRVGDRFTCCAETVLIPAVDCAFEAERAIAHAARAVTPAGQVFVHTDAAPSDHLVREIERLLLAYGFSNVRLKREDGVMLSAALPMFGPLV